MHGNIVAYGDIILLVSFPLNMAQKIHHSINTQISLLKEAAEILLKEIASIDQLGKTVLDNDLEDLIRATRLVYFRRCLLLFRDLSIFLIDKLQTDKQESFRFYVPNIRALLEIYSHLLYLSFQNLDRQAILCAVRDLSTLAKFSKKQEGIRDSYTRGLARWYLLFESAHLSMPQNPEGLTKKFIANNKLGFPSIEEMLKPEHIIKTAPKTQSVFPSAFKEPYKLYAYFSDYVHGNPMVADSRGTENFWIISKLTITISQLLELIDLKILGVKQKTEIASWIKKVETNRKPFADYWKKCQL